MVQGFVLCDLMVQAFVLLLVLVFICLFLLLFFFFVIARYPGGHCKEVRACKLQGAQGGDFQSVVHKVLARCFVLPRCLFYNFGYIWFESDFS